jgi:ferric-dicitrate binding protein FerR (iron transport regulator)
MDLTNMPIKLFLKKLTLETDFREEQRFNDRIVSNSRKMDEFKRIEKIWLESGKIGLFEQIDTDSDWELVRSRIRIPLTQKYSRTPVYSYALRVAAVIIIASGLSIGIYKTITFVNREKPAGYVSLAATAFPRNINLPDGSAVTLKDGSALTYRSDFGKVTREVILNGEALFEVVPDKVHPFKVYSGESVVVVTGTRFSVREEKGLVKVSVLSGNVLLSNTGEHAKQIRIAANQSGYLLPDHNLKIENKIEVNELSWKTGHLVFRETPIDTALIDIARHFRKDLVIETSIKEDITAEFQDQPLNEILDEINVVAGLKFDTTGTALIVRK